jgi:hypothetical protein
MAKYVKGAEDRPLKQINTSLPIKVYLRDLNAPDEADDVVAEYDLDLANFYDRKKIGRITHWAATNQHLVETLAMSDAIQDEKEVK